MNTNSPPTIQSRRVDFPIWTISYRSENHSLVIDCREEASQKIVLLELKVDTLQIRPVKIDISWFEKVLQIQDECIFSVFYPDIKDPGNYQFRKRALPLGEPQEIDALPMPDFSLLEPNLYQRGSDYFNTVSGFLGLDLPLACEYLEFKGHIIISYYLRSEDGFDRFLLLLKDGKKVWKLDQDRGMKGFSAGAFFVVEEALIFVRNRNEVCIYNL